ncbi:hypothetical protein ACN2EN_05655 [Aliarcobacter lanthieri]|uniref:hypothetical protein n=1 Tax=Aliarcobacter lanthieri TaxID=1355374 RepID=UPI003AFA0FB5
MKVFYYTKDKGRYPILKYLIPNGNCKDIIYVKSLKKVEANYSVFIYNLSDLGNSTFQILKNIFDLFSKNIDIHIYDNKKTLEYRTSYLTINILKEIHKIEEYKINNRLLRTKNTLIKKQKIVGRKSGKKTKSIFDKHKKIIFEELKKNTSKTEILKMLKQNDLLLPFNTTPQALGQYIKRQEKIKELKNLNLLDK